MATRHEVPSDDEVVATLQELRGHADAVALCRALMARGHPQLESQLAIQRAAERRRIRVDRDWTLKLNEPIAA